MLKRATGSWAARPLGGMRPIFFQRLMNVPAEPVALPRLDVCLAIILLHVAIDVDAVRPYRGAQTFIQSLIRGQGAWTRDYVAWMLDHRPLRGPRAMPVRARMFAHAVLRAFGAPRRLP